MQKGGEGVQIACKFAYVINGRPLTYGRRFDGIVFNSAVDCSASGYPAICLENDDAMHTKIGNFGTRIFCDINWDFLKSTCDIRTPRGAS